MQGNFRSERRLDRWPLTFFTFFTFSSLLSTFVELCLAIGKHPLVSFGGDGMVVRVALCVEVVPPCLSVSLFVFGYDI